MKALNYFSKPIKALLYLIILTLFALSVIFAFTKQLFEAPNDAGTFMDYCYKSASYSIPGLFDYSKVMVSKLSSTNSIFAQAFASKVNFEALATASKNIKIYLIIIICLFSLYIVLQLFDFRTYSNLLINSLTIVTFSFFKSFMLKHFGNETINLTVSSGYKLVILFLILTMVVNLLLIGFEELLDYFNKKQEKNKKVNDKNTALEAK